MYNYEPKVDHNFNFNGIVCSEISLPKYYEMSKTITHLTSLKGGKPTIFEESYGLAINFYGERHVPLEGDSGGD